MFLTVFFSYYDSFSTLLLKGVESRICGLSANDCEENFLDAGADCFLFKPFPCEMDALSRALIRVLYGLKKGSEGGVEFSTSTRVPPESATSV